MTSGEISKHKLGLKARKMPDKQLYDFVNQLSETKNTVEKFFQCLEMKNIRGIGPAIINKEICNFGRIYGEELIKFGGKNK